MLRTGGGSQVPARGRGGSSAAAALRGLADAVASVVMDEDMDTDVAPTAATQPPQVHPLRMTIVVRGSCSASPTKAQA